MRITAPELPVSKLGPVDGTPRMRQSRDEFSRIRSEAVMAATAYQLDGVLYSIASHRAAHGHFATWRCMSCSSVGGMGQICVDEASAIEAAQLLIAGHQARSHSTAASGGLFSLAYSSQAVQAFSKAALDDLAQRAAAKNGLLNVTGYLTYDVDFETFFQFLEGPRSVVEALLN